MSMVTLLQKHDFSERSKTKKSDDCSRCTFPSTHGKGAKFGWYVHMLIRYKKGDLGLGTDTADIRVGELGATESHDISSC